MDPRQSRPNSLSGPSGNGGPRQSIREMMAKGGSARIITLTSLVIVTLVLTGSGLPQAAARSFPVTAYNDSASGQAFGCGTEQASIPSFSSSSGTGYMSTGMNAKNCQSHAGATPGGSLAWTYEVLNLTTPVAIPTSSGGANVTWSLSLSTSTSAKVTSYFCPTTYRNLSYNYGYTWYNFSDTIQLCYVLSYLEIWGGAYLRDMNTGTLYLPSNWWWDSNTSGIENYSETYVANYSNSSYWAYNYSLWYGGFNYTAGWLGHLTGNSAPTLFFNGSFLPSHRYSVTTYVAEYSYVELSGFGGAAAASLSGSSSGHHLSLKIVTW